MFWPKTAVTNLKCFSSTFQISVFHVTGMGACNFTFPFTSLLATLMTPFLLNNPFSTTFRRLSVLSVPLFVSFTVFPSTCQVCCFEQRYHPSSRIPSAPSSEMWILSTINNTSIELSCCIKPASLTRSKNLGGFALPWSRRCCLVAFDCCWSTVHPWTELQLYVAETMNIYLQHYIPLDCLGLTKESNGLDILEYYKWLRIDINNFSNGYIITRVPISFLM